MYNFTFGQNDHFNKKITKKKNYVSFMPCAFNQNEHLFG
jgi:hypothetical protein